MFALPPNTLPDLTTNAPTRNLLLEVAANLVATAKNERSFFEFGKCFGIGNAGTDLAYHFGLDQTQSAPNPELTPAIISVSNGLLSVNHKNIEKIIQQKV